jgi:putative methyltransferase (TIGR04325 family)
MRSYALMLLARTPLGSALRRIPSLEAIYNNWALQPHDHAHLLSGVFSSYSEALAAIPDDRPKGWNTEGAASIWVDDIRPVRPSSYPLFFWLLHLLNSDSRVIDYGGSIGLTFYGYSYYTPLPEGATWTVVELSLIVAQGRQIAKREGAQSLSFTTAIGAPDQCDILIASGSLQYMASSVPGLLELRPELPRWILLNKLPFTQGPEFWSLDNFGPAIAPYRIFNEQSFLAYFVSCGYIIRDSWQIAEIKCDIPFHPEMHSTKYVGLCLEYRGPHT